MDMETRAVLLRARKAMEVLTEAASPDMTMRQLLVLLDVAAMTSPPALNTLAERHGLVKATSSRIISQMAGMEGDVRNKDGRDLLKVELDPRDQRARQISLSKNGDRVLTRVAKALMA